MRAGRTRAASAQAGRDLVFLDDDYLPLLPLRDALSQNRFCRKRRPRLREVMDCTGPMYFAQNRVLDAGRIRPLAGTGPRCKACV